MVDDEMDQAWRADQRVEATAADVLPKLEWLRDSIAHDGSQRQALSVAIDTLNEMRAQIVRRWD